MDAPATKRDLQKLADNNKMFYVHTVTELINIKSYLETLLNFEEARLMERGASKEEAHQMIENRVSEHQTRLGDETASFLAELPTIIDSAASSDEQS
jgi:hypothetical protein